MTTENNIKCLVKEFCQSNQRQLTKWRISYKLVTVMRARSSIRDFPFAFCFMQFPIQLKILHRNRGDAFFNKIIGGSTIMVVNELKHPQLPSRKQQFCWIIIFDDILLSRLFLTNSSLWYSLIFHKMLPNKCFEKQVDILEKCFLTILLNSTIIKF